MSSATDADTVDYDFPCKDPFSFSASTQTDTAKLDTYSNSPIEWTVTPFDIEPSLCAIEYTCDDVVRADGEAHSMGCDSFNFVGDLDELPANNKFSITVPESTYFDGSFPPGEYTIKIRGTTVKADTPRTAVVEFTLTLKDICNPPNTITPPLLYSDVEYTITTTVPDFGVGSWSIEPANCPFDFSATWTTLTPGNNPDTAITFDEGTDQFSVDYQFELNPID